MTRGTSASSEPAVASAIERLAPLLQKLTRIPTEARVFDLTADFALRRYRIPAAVLEAAIELGLPHRGSGAQRCFDRWDLQNVAIYTGVGPAGHPLRVFLPRTLMEVGEGPAHYRVRYLPQCAGHDEGECDYTLVTPEGPVRRVVPAGHTGPVLTLDVTTAEPRPSLSGEARELVDELSNLDFALLPGAIRRDTGLIRRTGLADCTGVAMLLTSECRRRGLTARLSYGLLLAPPVANRHYWTEIAMEDRWVGVDPVLLGSMGRWQVLDPGQWPPTRSLNAVLWRIADGRRELSMDGSTPTDIRFTAQLMA